MQDLTHFDEAGNARMVDVGAKEVTHRVATAEGFITVGKEIYDRIAGNTMKKGDVLSVAQLASIMGAKRTSDLIPLCHPLALTKVDVHCQLQEPKELTVTERDLLAAHGYGYSLGNSDTDLMQYQVKVTATVETKGQTGVEMEALTAVQVGLLTVYDMCKAIDKGMVMGPVYLVEKSGGKSGHFIRK